MTLEREILTALEPAVIRGLKQFPSCADRGWRPAQFFNFMEKDGSYEDDLRKLREGASGLSDELLVAVVGQTVTEEALPNYAMRSSNIARDETGTSEKPWARWQRAWNAEENQHGDALHQHLLLGGRVDMASMDLSTQHLIFNGFDQNPNVYHMLFYPMFQEPVARLGHSNTANLASQQGDVNLAQMCRKIAGDEHRHTLFFRGMGQELFSLTPEKSTVEFASLMVQGIHMPSQLMADNSHGKPRTLYHNFANVATNIGVYTAEDYANILDSLNGYMGIKGLMLSGEAAKAQETLMKLPRIMRRIGERKAKEVYDPVPFDWIYGRVA